MDGLKRAVSISILLAVICGSYGFKSNETWRKPCGGTQNRPSWVPRIERNETELLNAIDSGLNDLALMAMALKTRIATERIRNLNLIEYLDNSNYEYLPRMNVTTEEYRQNVTLVYLEMYRLLSKAGLLLERVYYDERHSQDNQFSNQLDTQQNKLYDALCNLENLIDLHESSVTSYISPFLPENARNVTSELTRYTSDYKIMKGTRDLYSNLIAQIRVINGEKSNM